MTIFITIFAPLYVAGAILAFALATNDENEDVALAAVWPLWLARSVWRAWNRPKPGTEQVRVVYRYPARTRLSRVVSWLWHVGMTGAVAWLVWRMH